MQVNINDKTVGIVGLLMAVGQTALTLAQGVDEEEIDEAGFGRMLLEICRHTNAKLSREEADRVQAFWARLTDFDVDNIDPDDPRARSDLEQTAEFMNRHGIKKDGGGGDS